MRKNDHKAVHKTYINTLGHTFKELVSSKSFSSFLIGCVRRPTPRTDKGDSSITDNMITFNGISAYNILSFKFKRYSL
jgi:hypothetical protein